MKKLSNIMDGLGNALLIIMFIVIMVVGSLAILSAYSSLQLSNKLIDVTLTEISSHLENHKVPEGSELSPQLIAYREQIRSESKGLLDSSTISFLFQIFSLSLVSAGIYLLSRSRANLQNADRKSKAAAWIVMHTSISSAIEGYCSLAHQSSWFLRFKPNQTTFATMQDNLMGFRGILIKADQEAAGIPRSHFNSILDRLRQIDTNLKSLSQDNANRIEGLSKICQKSIDLLESSGFSERFEENSAFLANNDPRSFSENSGQYY